MAETPVQEDLPQPEVKATKSVSSPKAKAKTKTQTRTQTKTSAKTEKATSMITAVGKKAQKGAKADHPSYFEMVKEAILALKERTGSSVHAIAKFISEKYPNLPGPWKKTLAYQIKQMAETGKLVKVKASFKLSDELKPPRSNKAKTSEAPAPVKKESAPKMKKKPSASPAKKASPKPKSIKKSSVKKAPTPKKAVPAKPKTAPRKVDATAPEKPALMKTTSVSLASSKKVPSVKKPAAKKAKAGSK